MTVKHAELIRAVLDGKVVQVGYHTGDGDRADWEDCTPYEAIAEMVANPDYAYRLKPEVVVRWMVVWLATGDLTATDDSGVPFDTREELVEYMKMDAELTGSNDSEYRFIRMILSADLSKVISCHVEAPL